jgi:arylsulfatase A-like enzyme
MRFFFVLWAILLLFPKVTFSQKTPPNVLLILSDDQGWGDLACNGNTFVETPNLDKLSKAGASLKNYYVSPLCAPTRASLLTGRYHLRTGVVSVSKGLEAMNSNETTLAELFKANNYATGIFGKWHNGKHIGQTPMDQGFDQFFGFIGGHWSNYFDTKLQKNDQMVPTTGYITDVLTNAAINFIDQNKEQPFFCYLPYNAPHSPYQVPDQYFDKYKAKGLNNELATVYGMVDNMDQNIGRLLAYLEEKKLADNTIVIFMTDNGPNGVRYNGIMKGTKSSVNEGGMRVPCYIKWPNVIKPETSIEALTGHIDIYPTLQKLCSLKQIPTKPLDGIDLSKVLLGKKTLKDNRFIYSHVNHLNFELPHYPGAVRTPTYRLVYLDSNKPELYNMQKDPSQLTNIAQLEPKTVEKLSKKYLKWFKESTRNLDLTRPIPLNKRAAHLTADEAKLGGKLYYNEGHGWVHDYIVNWKTPSDTLTWNIAVEKDGPYALGLECNTFKESIGQAVKAFTETEAIENTLNNEGRFENVPSPDRIARKEMFERKHWNTENIGVLNLKKGNNTIKIVAPNAKGLAISEVNGIIVKPHYN